jgi:hypothetical protein
MEIAQNEAGSVKSRILPAVDLIVNSYEKTYRLVLSPGFFTNIVNQNQRSFERTIALLNNVNDRRDAEARAELLLNNGEIDAYYHVADHLDRALQVAGLAKRDLGRMPHYTDCSLVAVTLPGSPYVVYWDAEVCLQYPANWIDPALELMECDPRVLVTNPNWASPTLESETLLRAGGFAFGYGFSDQLFLVRRGEFSRPIYKQRCLASLRYPTAHIATIFEQRVDAYMRKNGRLRATFTGATYEHRGDEGVSYPATSLAERAKRFRNQALTALLRRVPTTKPCLKV